MTCFSRINAGRESELFLDSDVLIGFKPSEDMADLAVMAGLFRSRTQAIKNNWKGPVPSGWSEHGSRKNRMYVWNPELDDHVWKHPCWVRYDIDEVIDWSIR